jgi:hypothetical protein
MAFQRHHLPVPAVGSVLATGTVMASEWVEVQELARAKVVDKEILHSTLAAA